MRCIFVLFTDQISRFLVEIFDWSHEGTAYTQYQVCEASRDELWPTSSNLVLGTSALVHARQRRDARPPPAVQKNL